MYDLVRDRRLFDQVFENSVTGERSKATYYIVLRFLGHEFGIFMATSTFGLCIGPPLLLYFFWHFYLVWVGVTGNERAKWRTLRASLEKQGPTGRQQLRTLCNIYDEGVVANFQAAFFPIDICSSPSGTREVPRALAASPRSA
eukprot:CAMPEP_0117492952 /NCGR_PEP_ID=MMETSP0784-20121206/18849_1 /TAXON_ID=39447 /ORGANISM="" /LENGTH=142 /DNA_ID=CAMNT_0005287793 /DNA_START=610 /DNA_END=1034 /DNA_ORIENTATION=+